MTFANPVGQELHAYDPTWRDQMASLFMGDKYPSLARLNFVQGLLGSTGLGTTGIGLADLTPLGALFGVQEALRAGDYQGAALAITPFGAIARGGKALTRKAPSVVENDLVRASKSASIYNPPAKPPRAFEADYPQGAQADAGGRLTQDIEGRPLTAKRVVGRGVVGGKDEALSPAEYDALTEEITGRGSEMAALRRLAGAYEKRPLNQAEFDALTRRQQAEHSGFEGRIFLNSRLRPQDVPLVHAHELGHVINDAVGTETTYATTRFGRRIPFREIPISGEMELELSLVYRELNNGKTPKDFGYKGDDVRSELMAEAIRAYMADPNYIKSVAPNTAAQIRAAVNPNPRLNRVLQFNAIGGFAALPILGAELSDSSQ